MDGAERKAAPDREPASDEYTVRISRRTVRLVVVTALVVLALVAGVAIGVSFGGSAGSGDDGNRAATSSTGKPAVTATTAAPATTASSAATTPAPAAEAGAANGVALTTSVTVEWHGTLGQSYFLQVNQSNGVALIHQGVAGDGTQTFPNVACGLLPVHAEFATNTATGSVDASAVA